MPILHGSRVPGPARKGEGSLGSWRLRISWGRTLARQVQSLGPPPVSHTQMGFFHSSSIFMAGFLLWVCFNSLIDFCLYVSGTGQIPWHVISENQKLPRCLFSSQNCTKKIKCLSIQGGREEWGRDWHNPCRPDGDGYLPRTSCNFDLLACLL